MKLADLILSVVVAVLLYSPAGASADVYSAEIIEYGIFEAQAETEHEDTNAPQGQLKVLTNIRLVDQTDRIPAALGVRFGIRYRILGSPEGQVPITLRYSYPALKDPITKQSYTSNAVSMHLEIGKAHYNDYSFEEPWEMVPGVWSLQLFHQGKLLAEKNFAVYIKKGR